MHFPHRVAIIPTVPVLSVRRSVESVAVAAELGGGKAEKKQEWKKKESKNHSLRSTTCKHLNDDIFLAVCVLNVPGSIAAISIWGN